MRSLVASSAARTASREFGEGGPSSRFRCQRFRRSASRGGSRDSALGNLIAAAMPRQPGVEAALTRANAGGIPVDRVPGVVTTERLSEDLP